MMDDDGKPEEIEKPEQALGFDKMFDDILEDLAETSAQLEEINKKSQNIHRARGRYIEDLNEIMDETREIEALAQETEASLKR